MIALLSGAIGPLAFSPNHMWLIGFVSVMGFYVALKFASPRQGAITGWFFGLGFFGVGASWVFVSINVYGNAGELLAGFLTFLFVAGLALLYSLQSWLNQRFFHAHFICSVLPPFGYSGNGFAAGFLPASPGYIWDIPTFNPAFPDLPQFLVYCLSAWSWRCLEQALVKCF